MKTAEKVPTEAGVTHCEAYGCAHKVAIIFKGTADPETWVTNVCDECLGEFCAKCCAWDEIYQKPVCVDCIAQLALKVKP